MNTILETERLIMREWTPEDVGALFEMCSDAEVMRYIGDGLAWSSVERAREWLARRAADYEERGYSPFAVVEKRGGKIVGSCGFTFLPKLSEVDFGYVFARASWGQGFATEAARAVLRYGFERLGFAEVTANTAQCHHASRRVLEKIGFEYRGLRRYEGDDEDAAFYVARNPLSLKAVG